MEYPKDHLSYSAVNAYLECPMKWYYNYVEVTAPIEEPWVFRLGTLYHKALEALYSKNDYMMGYNLIQEAMDSEKGFHKRDVQKIMECYENYNEKIFPMYQGKVEDVEFTGRFDIAEVGVPFEYRVDLTTIDGCIIDHKTVGSAGRNKPNIDHSLQLSLYAYGYYIKHNRLPRKVEYHYAYKDTGTVEVIEGIPSMSDMLKAIACVKGVYKAITNDIFYPNFKASCNTCSHKGNCSGSYGLI